MTYSDRSGFFWFFDSDNAELGVKIIDGRNSNGKFWVYTGSATSLNYTLTVTDMQKNVTQAYSNASGDFWSIVAHLFDVGVEGCDGIVGKADGWMCWIIF